MLLCGPAPSPSTYQLLAIYAPFQGVVAMPGPHSGSWELGLSAHPATVVTAFPTHCSLDSSGLRSVRLSFGGGGGPQQHQAVGLLLLLAPLPHPPRDSLTRDCPGAGRGAVALGVSTTDAPTPRTDCPSGHVSVPCGPRRGSRWSAVPLHPLPSCCPCQAVARASPVGHGTLVHLSAFSSPPLTLLCQPFLPLSMCSFWLLVPCGPTACPEHSSLPPPCPSAFSQASKGPPAWVRPSRRDAEPGPGSHEPGLQSALPLTPRVMGSCCTLAASGCWPALWAAVRCLCFKFPEDGSKPPRAVSGPQNPWGRQWSGSQGGRGGFRGPWQAGVQGLPGTEGRAWEGPAAGTQGGVASRRSSSPNLPHQQ